MRLATVGRGGSYAPRRRLAEGVLCFLATLLLPGLAFAQDAKATASAIVERSLARDLEATGPNAKSAQELGFAKSLCASKCPDENKAEIALAQGIVAGYAGDEAAAKAAFDEARALSPGISLPKEHDVEPIASLFGTPKPAAAVGPDGEVIDPTPDPPAVKPKEPPPEKPAEAPAPKPKPKKKVTAGHDTSTSHVDVRALAEVSGYHDDDAVDVVTPAVALSVENPVDGWGITGSFLVDVVSAASVDIVATASPKWLDVRYVPGLSGTFKAGDYIVSGSGGMSHESDYTAVYAGVGLGTELADKRFTPSLSYDFGYDWSGRAGTPFSTYVKTIHRHGVTASAAIVVDKATLLVPSATAVFEFGDSAKPYRYLPVFAPGVDVEPGESIDSVNAKRLPARMEEAVPDTKQRYAVAALLAHRLSKVTIRISERLYADSWGLKASTTDFMLPWDATGGVRLWPHARLHIQSGVNFWKLAYRAEPSNSGPLVLPRLRVGDAELGPMFGLTFGGGARFDFGATDNMSLTFTADAIFSRFSDHLYRQGRLAGFGSATYEVLFE